MEVSGEGEMEEHGRPTAQEQWETAADNPESMHEWARWKLAQTHEFLFMLFPPPRAKLRLINTSISSTKSNV